MKKLFLCLLLIVLFSYPAIAGTINDKPIYVEGEVIVLMKAPPYEENISVDAYSQLLLEQAEALAKKYGLECLCDPLTTIAIVTGKNIFVLRSENKSTEELVEELVKELSSDPDVISVQPNYIYQKTPEPKNGGGCNNKYGNNLLLLSGLMLLATNRKEYSRKLRCNKQ